VELLSKKFIDKERKTDFTHKDSKTSKTQCHVNWYIDTVVSYKLPYSTFRVIFLNHPQDEASKFFQNVGTYISVYKALHPKRLEFS